MFAGISAEKTLRSRSRGVGIGGVLSSSTSSGCSAGASRCFSASGCFFAEGSSAGSLAVACSGSFASGSFACSSSVLLNSAASGPSRMLARLL